MTLALILVRWLHLSASILLGGLFLFEAAIILPATKKTSEATGDLLARNHRLTCTVAFRILLVALVSWFAWSWLVASIMSGDDLVACLQNGDWVAILIGTQFGHTWLFRVIVYLLTAIILWVLTRSSGRQNLLRSTLAGLSVIEVVSLAGVSHATATPGPLGIVHLLGDGLHLLASAFWPAGLAPLATLLFLLLKSKQVEAIAIASPLVRRFSVSSLIAVAVLALTGILNSIFMLGSLRLILTSNYGQILIFKLILFSTMVGFGAWNLCILKPQMAAELPIASLEEKSAVPLLLRNVLWELGLGTLVLLVVGLLGITSPPNH
jgi:copper resistance protein D